MNDKEDKIRELKNLIHELTFNRRLMKNKKERINELKMELEELERSLESEIYTEDSKPILNL